MIRPRMLVLAAFGLTFTAAAAEGQDERLRARLDPATASAVQALVDQATAAGLPSEALVLKALEGASKGARGPQIVAVVTRLHTHIGVARSAIGAPSAPADIVAGAAALQAGLQADVLRGIRAARPEGSLVVPLSVLTDLVTRGVPPHSASAEVLALLKRGTSDDQLAQFGRRVVLDIVRGTPPSAAVSQARPAPPAGIPAHSGAPPAQRGPEAGRPPIL